MVAEPEPEPEPEPESNPYVAVLEAGGLTAAPDGIKLNVRGEGFLVFGPYQVAQVPPEIYAAAESLGFKYEEEVVSSQAIHLRL